MAAADKVSIFVSSEATICPGDGSKLFGVGEGGLWSMTDAVRDGIGEGFGVSVARLSVKTFGVEQALRRKRIRTRIEKYFFKSSPPRKRG